MGLFAPRPQEPQDWAGLPSEPHSPQPDATALDAFDSVDLAGTNVSGATTTSVSVSFSMPEVGRADDAGAAKPRVDEPSSGE